MTSLAEGEAKSLLRGRLVWLALALSLTLNVFFIAGLIWSRMEIEHPPSFAERIVRAGAALNLSSDQRDAFQHFAQTVQDRTKEMRESNQPLFRHAWEEMAKPQPDQALINGLLDQTSDNRRTYQKDVAAAITAFLGNLSPEQRAQFIELAKHPAPHSAPLRR